jgi:hypothetical protein
MQRLIQNKKNMKKKDVIGIDVSKLTIDAYLKLAQAHAVFGNDTKGFRQLVKWIRKNQIIDPKSTSYKTFYSLAA